MPSSLRPPVASLRDFAHVKYLGAGAFAEVNLYRAPDGALVAVKSVRRSAHTTGANLGAIKELQALSELVHPNVLSLRDVVADGERVHLVFEYCAGGDLERIARDERVPLGEAAIKGFFMQLLRGLAAVHDARLMHRDVKPENVLLTGDGVVKLADFGLTAPVAHAAPGEWGARPMHPRVATLWYRAPELLMRARLHGAAVDMWAAGAILAELFIRAPIFSFHEKVAEQDEDARQLAVICRVIGTPVDPFVDAPGAAAALKSLGLSGDELAALRGDEGGDGGGGGARAGMGTGAGAGTGVGTGAGAAAARARLRGLPHALTVWPGCSALPGYLRFEQRAPLPWRDVHPALRSVSGAAIDLISRLLVFDPFARLSAKEALAHEWFKHSPSPLSTIELAKLLGEGGS